MTSLKRDDARTLLAVTHQLRAHWSTVNVSLLGVAITVNAAIWSYFLKSYVDALTNDTNAEPTYILLAGAISAVLSGLLRLYARYIDHQIANLYPDLLLYEGVLDPRLRRSTSRYLQDAVKYSDRVLLAKDLTLEQKVEALSELARRKRMGNRGHALIDICALVFFFIILIAQISVVHASAAQVNTLMYACFIVTGVGFVFLVGALTGFQRNPCETDIKQAVDMAKRTSSRAGRRSVQGPITRRTR